MLSGPRPCPDTKRYEEDDFLDAFYDFFGNLKHYRREEKSAEPVTPRVKLNPDRWDWA